MGHLRITLVAISAYMMTASASLQQVISRQIRGIEGAIVLANVCICLMAIDFTQAARAVLSHKRCHDAVIPMIDLDDVMSLFHVHLDQNTRLLILPSAAAILTAIIVFRRHWSLQLIGTSLNIWAAAQLFYYFQNRAWCLFDEHGYEEESAIEAYILLGFASLALITVFGTFRLLRRKHAPILSDRSEPV